MLPVAHPRVSLRCETPREKSVVCSPSCPGRHSRSGNSRVGIIWTLNQFLFGLLLTQSRAYLLRLWRTLSKQH